MTSDRGQARRSAVRVAVGLVAVVTMLGVVGVVLHLPRVRGLFGVQGRCPAIGKVASGPDLEAARRAAVAPLAGETTAPGLAVSGLVLGESTRAAVRAWAKQGDLRCEDVDGVALRCGEAKALLPIPTDGFFRFDDDRLVGIDAVGALPSADLAAFDAARSTLVQTFGAPHHEDRGSDWEKSKVGRVGSGWRFRDLAVDLSAFVVGDTRRMRLQVRLLR